MKNARKSRIKKNGNSQNNTIKAKDLYCLINSGNDRLVRDKPKIIVILGPTSSGKSDVAISLARKFDGEVISADSRQVYRGLDIGTGKTLSHEQKGIKHHLIDNISPGTDYNAARFKKDADKIIISILQRKKLPIICGGTGFWIKSVVDNVSYPEVKPNSELRNKLRNKSAEKLFETLKKLDPERAKNIDAKNKVRLIRAIEICKSVGKVPNVQASPDNKYDFLQIGISLPKEKLHENIKKRLRKRFDQGMVEEVERLHSKEKLSWKKIESFGLGYFWIPKYLRGVLKDEDELFEKIFHAEKNYAKKQMTWFKKDGRIKWMKNIKDMENETGKFLHK